LPRGAGRGFLPPSEHVGAFLDEVFGGGGHQILEIGQVRNISNRELIASKEFVLRQMRVSDVEGLLTLGDGSSDLLLVGFGPPPRREEIFTNDRHKGRGNVGGLNRDPLFHHGTLLDIFGNERVASGVLLVEVAADGSRFVEHPITVDDGWNLAPRLQEDVRGLLVSSSGKIDEVEIELLLLLEEGAKKLASTGGARMTVDSDRHCCLCWLE